MPLLHAHRERAPEAANAPGGVILWFLDATETESEIGRLQRDASRLFLSGAQMGGIRFLATELPIGLLALGLAIFFNRRAK